nr:hypothetical protein [Tanacetum cinerariifolium]
MSPGFLSATPHEFLQNVFPISKGYKLPTSYYATKKTFKMIGLGYESIHACEYDRCLFRGKENKDLDFCPMCNTSRWKDSNTPRKKVPKKVLRYFLSIPRLQRLYKSSHTSKEMIWHATRKCIEHNNDKDPEVSTTSELFALACGPTWTPISINSCVVDGVRYVVHSRDERRITQNSGICSPGPDGEMYYGQLQEILEFKYLLFKVVLFRDGPDIIHFDNSSDLPLSTSLNYLDNATLHIDGQSTEVDVPPNIIIDVVDEDDDITDDEDALPHDLEESDNEDLINVDDDEDLKGGPIRPKGMFPFERYMKKLKGYDVTMKFNRPDHNVDPLPQRISFRCSNSLEIDTYRSQLKSLFPNKAMKEESPTGLGRRGEAFKNGKYILVTELKQVFYLEDKAKPHWKVVKHVNHKKFSNGGVIVVEDDPDIISFDNSSDLPLSASLNDLDNATLHIDGQSTEIDAPPVIIDVPNEDDVIINDEDALPHDLAYLDDEDLINVDDDGVDKVYSSEEED